MKKKQAERFIDTKEFALIVKKVKKVIGRYPWCMIGGRAVEVWANPPQTPDVDFLVEFRPKDAKVLIEEMKTAKFVLLRQFFDKNYAPMFFFKDEEFGVEVDLIGAFEDVHFWAIERAARKTISGVSVNVAQPEDIVILKANAALTPRRGEKVPRDMAAIKAIAESVDLDIDYIEVILTQASADWSDERALLNDLGIKV